MTYKEQREVLSDISMLKRDLAWTQRKLADAMARMDSIYALLEDLETDLEGGS